MTRRDFTKISFSFIASVALLNAKENLLDTREVVIDNLNPLSTNLSDGDYGLKIEGEIPKDLKGSLYRNGPALFKRDGKKRASIIDGDGYITKLDISNNTKDTKLFGKYVQTAKYLEEEAKGKFIYDTWTTSLQTKDSKSILDAGSTTQSSVSIKKINGSMYAFDESNLPHKIDKDTLGTSQSDDMFHFTKFHNAHGKTDPKTNEFINFGLEYGPSLKLHVYSIKDGKKLFYKEINITSIDRSFSNILGRGCYLHDFFVSENFIAFNLQPLLFDVRKFDNMAKFFFNDRHSLAHSFVWKPELKNKLLILSRKNIDAKPIEIETQNATFSWHTFNAYEEKDKLILDFVGYDNSNFFDEKTNALAQMMHEGKVTKDTMKTTPMGDIMRYEVGLKNYDHKTGKSDKPTLKEITLSKANSHEFCTINPNFACTNNTYGYATSHHRDYNGFLNGITKINFKTLKEENYFFGKDYIAGEFVFCKKTNANNKSAEDDGYLVATVFNSKKNETFIAIFDAKDIAKGTVSKIYLDKNLTLRLHGDFVSA